MKEGHTIILDDCLKRIGELERHVKLLYKYREEHKDHLTELSERIEELSKGK